MNYDTIFKDILIPLSHDLDGNEHMNVLHHECDHMHDDDAASRKEEIKRERWDGDSIIKKHPRRRKWPARITI